MQLPGNGKGIVNPVPGFRIAGVVRQTRQFGKSRLDGEVGMNDAAVVDADSLDRFRHQPPGLVGRLGRDF